MARPVGAPTLTIDQTIENVTVLQNVPGAYSDLVRVLIPPRLVYRFYAGEVWKMKLFDTNGDELARSSRILWGIRKPNQRQLEEFFSSNYGPWRALSENDQNRRENQGSLGINFAGPHLDIMERQLLVVQIESPQVVDWSHPESFFETTFEEILL